MDVYGCNEGNVHPGSRAFAGPVNAPDQSILSYPILSYPILFYESNSLFVSLVVHGW
jgi:hypothetical protein